MLRQGLSIIPLLWAFNLANAKSSYKDFRVRIKIAKNLSTVQFSGIDLKNRFFARSEVKSYPGRRVIKFNCLAKKKKTKLKKTGGACLLSFPHGTYFF